MIPSRDTWFRPARISALPNPRIMRVNRIESKNNHSSRLRHKESGSTWVIVRYERAITWERLCKWISREYYSPKQVFHGWYRAVSYQIAERKIVHHSCVPFLKCYFGGTIHITKGQASSSSIQHHNAAVKGQKFTRLFENHWQWMQKGLQSDHEREVGRRLPTCPAWHS